MSIKKKVAAKKPAVKKKRKIDELDLTKEGSVKVREKLNYVGRVSVQLGCDPEFFFKVNKRIVGSEHFIPATGFKYYGDDYPNYKFVQDGVQAELNPQPNTCRANLANGIAKAFERLDAEIKKTRNDVEFCFDQTVTISKTELDKLDDKNKRFGCMPSFNAYDPDAAVRLNAIDPLVYRKRSAGGHIHISTNSNTTTQKLVKESPEKFTHLLDIIVGNTCVLIDRDKGNKERRKAYGRAGEYRLPKHGYEYRVLSNFWLQHAALLSLCFGLTHLTVSIVCHPQFDKYYQQLTEAVSLDDIQKAINENDFKLAYKNFKAIEAILCDALTPGAYGSYGIDSSCMYLFHHFIERVNTKGMKYWFKKDPIDFWKSSGDCHAHGFGLFINNQVLADYQKKNGKPKPVHAPAVATQTVAGVIAGTGLGYFR